MRLNIKDEIRQEVSVFWRVPLDLQTVHRHIRDVNHTEPHFDEDVHAVQTTAA